MGLEHKLFGGILHYRWYSDSKFKPYTREELTSFIMANNRLYIADKESKKAVTLAKSNGLRWRFWTKNIQDRLSVLFNKNIDCADVGDKKTNLIIITEYDEDFDLYEVIE